MPRLIGSGIYVSVLLVSAFKLDRVSCAFVMSHAPVRICVRGALLRIRT